MKRKVIILTLAWAGATMCSQKDEAASGGEPTAKSIVPAAPAAKPAPAKPDAPSSLLDFTVGKVRFYVLKVAAAGHVPKGTFYGKEAYLKAASSSMDKSLLIILVPSGAKGAVLRHEAGGKAAAVEAPRLIYRMPGSPAHAFLILDRKIPGTLSVTLSGGETGRIDLGNPVGRLEAIPFHWDAEAAGYLGYRSLPADLYGKPPG